EDQNKDTSTYEDVASTNPSKPFVKFVKPKDSQPESKSKEQETPKKSQVKYPEQNMHSNKRPKGNQRNCNNLKSYHLGPEFVLHKKPCYNCGDLSHLANDCRRRVQRETNWSQNHSYKSSTHRSAGHRPNGTHMRPPYRSSGPRPHRDSMRPTFRPAGHRPHGPSMNLWRPTMNGARPYKAFFQAPSYETRPFLKSSAEKNQYRAPWVPLLIENFPLNKMHKVFPLPVIEFLLAEDVPTASEESSHCQKKRDATAKRIALLVIEFGDSYEVLASAATTETASGGTGKKSGRTVTVTTEDMQKRKNDVKERTTLLLSFLDEHQLRFSKYKTAQELWAVILKTLGGNEATKKTKKNLLKQQYGNFKAEGLETLEQTFNRLQVIVGQLQFMDIEIKQDDLNQKGNEDVNAASVSTASTNVPTAIANNGIDEDDMEEMDIKWSMALLSMRAEKFWKKIGKEISIQGSDVAGFDKSKVECFNYHKMVEEQAPKALMAINGVGWDWSYMANNEENHSLVADEEAPTEFALMANTSAESKVFDNSMCFKDCKKNNDSLNSKITDLTNKLFDAKNMIYHYKLGLAQVESRLVKHKEREIKYCKKIRGLELDVKFNTNKFECIAKELETQKKENEGVDGKLAGFLTASKDLDNLIESQRSDKNKEGLEYSIVPPPAQIYSFAKKDLSWTGLLEIADDTVTNYRRPSPTMESTSGDDQNRNSSVSETDASSSTITPKPFIKFVKPNDSPSKSKTGKTKTPKKPPVKNFPPVNRKFSTGSRNFPTANRKFPTANRKFPTGSTKFSTTDMEKKGKAGSSQNNFDDKGYWDSGCSRHMIGNISHLSDFEPFEGRYVSFGQGECKITGKGTIKTDKLKFENVYFVKDLKYNLFSVSQICDNKNSVTDSECIVLGRDFKLLDDANILLRTPRQHNMYSIDLNKIVPHKDLTCLVAKASANECMLWHRRLGHLNFKIMNKFVRYNLVRGLPTKCFENDHTCTACLKGKQHKASCKSKLVNSVSKPLHTLNMDLFGPTSVSSISHKWHCLVVTDDFSRFTWTFFLKTKDETSGILRKFITKIKNLKDLKVKIIMCDNGGEFRNKEMNNFCSHKGIKREFSNARTPQQNGVAEKRNRTLIEASRTMLADAKIPVTFWAEAVNTAYNLGKFEAKGDEEFLENKAIEKGAGPNWLFDIDSLTKSMNYVPVDASTNSTNLSGIKDAANQEVKKDVSFLIYNALPTWVHDAPIPTVSLPIPTACLNDYPEPSSDTRFISKRVSNQEETPSLDNILTLANWFEDILGVTTNSVDLDGVEVDVSNMETTITASPTPILRIHKDHPKSQIISHVDTPIQTRNKSKEVEAMQEELLQFKIQNVWNLVDCPKGVRPIGTKWVLKNNKDERGIVIRNKARLVAQGHTQEEGINYDEVFAPVARIKAIRLFLAYASLMGFIVYQMDVKSAFLYGTTDEEVYFCDYHNMVAILEKSEHNIDFHPIVDFVEVSPLRTETTDEGTKILANVDGILRTVTESSLRRNLMLQDEEGINEPASPLRDVIQGEAYPTDFGFIADHDRVNIAKSSTLPYDPAPRVTSPADVEGRGGNQQVEGQSQLLEDRDGVAVERSREVAPIKGRNLDEGEAAAERVSDDSEEMATVLTSMDAAIVLAGGVTEVPTGSESTQYTRRKGKETMVESETLKRQKVQEQIDTQVARELEEQMVREDQRKSEQIARDAEIARIHTEEELQIMIDTLDRSNETVAKYLKEYQQFASELPLERRIELISDLIKYQDNYAKIYKYQSQERKPLTKKQQREFYTAEEAERFKRKRTRFEQESTKKLKTSEEVPKDVKPPDEVPEEKVKEMMQMVPIKEVYVEALQVKHPIIDWKVHTERKRSYWKITRLGGSSASY
nr:hypothetical protein [Tanacetum cinerariifolium]